MTRRNYNVEIYSNVSNSKAQILDSTYDLPTKINLKRSKNDLDIQLISDTSKISFTVKTSPNPVFLYGNLLWMQVSPAAYLIDFTNQKRFYYGKSIYLDINDSNRIIRPPVSKFYYDYFSKIYPSNKGQINIVLSLPWINSFYLQPQNESSKLNTGFWGISFGLEYFYKEYKYISLNANAVSDFFVPVPAAVDISGEYEMMSSTYFSITDNFKFKRFSVGYGINYSKNTWDFRYYDRFDPPPPTRVPIKRKSESIGLTLNGYHQFGNHFHLGLIYRPTFLMVNPEVKFKYEHLISLDFAWKFRLKK
jgi:hypothetical protein